MNPSTASSVASLGNIGRWAVAPLLEVLHLYKWYTHTHEQHTERRKRVKVAGREGGGPNEETEGQQSKTGMRAKHSNPPVNPYEPSDQDRLAVLNNWKVDLRV